MATWLSRQKPIARDGRGMMARRSHQCESIGHFTRDDGFGGTHDRARRQCRRHPGIAGHIGIAVDLAATFVGQDL